MKEIIEARKKIEVAVRKVTEEQLSKLDSTIENMMKQMIASLLGLSYSWGKAEVDHCNGRNSILTTIIEEKARKQVEKLVSTFKFDENDKEVLEAFKKEYKEQLRRRISWHAENEAKRIAGIMIQKFTDKELTKFGFEKDPEVKAEVKY